jgi:hypothetical protein
LISFSVKELKDEGVYRFDSSEKNKWKFLLEYEQFLSG